MTARICCHDRQLSLCAVCAPLAEKMLASAPVSGAFQPVREYPIFCNNCQREFPAGVGHDCHVSRVEFAALQEDVRELTTRVSSLAARIAGRL